VSVAIGSVSELVAVIRRQLGATAPGDARRARASQGGGARRYTERNLPALIEARVRQIGRDDPQRGRKAFRVFLEAVLLTHLGEELMNDPRFYQLLDDVQRALEDDPSSAGLVKQAVDHLLAGADDVPARR